MATRSTRPAGKKKSPQWDWPRPNLLVAPKMALSNNSLVLGRESEWNEPYKPSLVVSFKGIPGVIPTFPTEHQQNKYSPGTREARNEKPSG